MLKKKILCAILFLFVITHLCAQRGSVKGIVVEALSNEPIPYASVIIPGTTIGTTTDSTGGFQLKGIQPGFVRIKASFIGYESVISSEVEISNAKTAFVEIKMEKRGIQNR